jgi:ABC-type sulfate transport system permease component
MKLVLIVTGTVTDVPQTLPHLVSGVIILQVIYKTGMLTRMIFSFNHLKIQMKMSAHAH